MTKVLIKIEKIQECGYCKGRGVLFVGELKETIQCVICSGECIQKTEDTLTVVELRRLLGLI